MRKQPLPSAARQAALIRIAIKAMKSEAATLETVLSFMGGTRLFTPLAAVLEGSRKRLRATIGYLEANALGRAKTVAQAKKAKPAQGARRPA